MIATNIVGAGVIAWAISVTLVYIFQCKPIRGGWDHSIPATCVGPNSFRLSNALLNIVTDVIILTLPIPNVWGLQMSVKQKYIVSGLFLLGGW